MLTLSGLDGDAEGGYYIEGFIHLATSSGGTILSWQPNGLTTNQEGRANTDVGAYSDVAVLNFTGSINIADAPLALQFRSWWSAQPLVSAIKANDVSATIISGWFLGYFNDTRTVDLRIPGLMDNDSSVRWRSTEALGYLGDDRAVEPLISALKDNNSSVRETAAWVLGRLKDARAAEPLVIATHDKNGTVRWNALIALAELNDKRAVDPLIAVLKDSNSHHRWTAAC